MSLLAIVPALLLLTGCVVYVFRGHSALDTVRPKSQLEYLNERKDVIYENLRDLNFEFRAGKYPPEDYARQRDELEQEAASVLARIEAVQADRA